MCTDFHLTKEIPELSDCKIKSGARGRNVNIIDVMPDPKTLPDGTNIGYYSISLPNGEKFIPFQYAKNFEGVTDTETSFTRQWLKGHGKRIVRRAEYWHYRTTRAPLFVSPSIIDDAVYIDIVAAYPSIYKFLGWKTDYIRGRYWGVGAPMSYPFPMSWKAGRSFVISGARHMQYGRYVSNGVVKVKPYISQLSNPPLVAGVYDVLSMIGRFAQYALRAAYWNVDGGIIPAPAAEIMMPFLKSIGLEGRIKYEGKAVVLSSGYWAVGGHKTKRYEANKSGYAHAGDFIPMTKDEAEWVYKNFQTITERNK